MSWEKEKETLKKEIGFKNQSELAEFVLRLAKHSDEANHHADFDIRYNKLFISITTHDAGGLTEKDYYLSKVIDGMLDN